MVRPLAFLSLSAVVAASFTPPIKHESDPSFIKDLAPVITTVEANRSYVVKLECVGCPFAVIENELHMSWEQPPRDNSLFLKFDVDKSNSALLLNGHRILPLDPMPLFVNALQWPTNVTKDTIIQLIKTDFKPTLPRHQEFPLQYEHTLLRTEEAGQLWFQFNVTGLPWGATNEPVKMGQKVVQVLLREQGSGNGISIEDIQVVEAKDRVQPYKMKCGKLAMVRTAFDPNEWDEYGKFGTWSRLWNLVMGSMGDFWFNNLQHNALMLPLALLLAVSIFLARLLYQQRHQENVSRDGDDDAETALLGREDAPPPYADIPVIKIEEYD
ncbi:hypothetical protein EJ02DRAFT_423350 [Clathrospora elynae]|uniref:DUF7728 domain-containing protein n=1 Tax=Clathrospora elynae TaxID=706981 RepID=A0A6A5SN52_9PLEO|nr:hypothetical protein EJ02DRAFT_423350 [Clathrospora elynae]